MSKIDLGRSFRDDINHIAPAAPDDKHYPELHIPDSDDDRLLDLPDSGTAEIKFKVVRRHHREESNGDKKKRRTCSITLEIHSISAPEKKAKKTHWEMFNGK